MDNSRAFVFDMDGTLVDNSDYHIRSWLALLAELGLPATEEDVRRLTGKTNEETLRQLAGDALSEPQIAAFAERKESLYRALYRPHLKPVAGLDGFLRAAHALGIPMAVATSAGRPNIDFILGGLGVEPCFEVVVGAEQVQRGKPHPDMYVIAAEGLGVAPERCLVFEDSLMGIESARRAGMRVVAVATTLDAQTLAGVPGVARVVADFTALDPASALALLNPGPGEENP